MSLRIFAVLLLALVAGSPAWPAETLWIEAEHLEGVKGYCWPMGRPEQKKTAGHWGLSGPGWAAEWNQGGESGFLSIACGGDDDKAVATKTIEVPESGRYFVWVRYGDWREKTERFQVRLEQEGQPAWVGRYGEEPLIDEDSEMKLYYGWAFVWGKQETTLKKGQAKLSLVTTTKDPEPRQVDVIVLTSDAGYRPRIKERPLNHTWEVLKAYRRELDNLEPLTRKVSVSPHRQVGEKGAFELPPEWKLRTFNDRGLVYLWNAGTGKPWNWFGDEPNRILYPYNVADDDTRKEFEQKYGGKKDVPIFSDSRVAPAFHGVGPGVFATDPKTGEVNEGGRRFAKWLDDNPQRLWGMMSNYHAGLPIGPKGQELAAKYRDRFVGAIAGESLGPASPDSKALEQATAGVTSRRRLAEIISEQMKKATADKFRTIYGKEPEGNPYADVISCLSVGNTAYIPLCADWGAKTIGYESAAMTASLLPMRWAFMRGAARQWDNRTATYRSCNFGDSATIFSKQSTYSTPRAIYDNYYSVYSGAGMTWYKFDIL